MNIPFPGDDPVAQFVLAAHQDLERVTLLYSQDPSLLTKKNQQVNEDALQGAGHMGQRAIAEFLLAMGAPPTIFSAAMLGDLHQVQEFIDEDPAGISTPGIHGISLPYHAALSGNIDLVAWLLARGALRDQRMLLAGTIGNHPELVRWLLEQGIDDYSITDIWGKTPLQIAEQREYQEIANILRERIQP